MNNVEIDWCHPYCIFSRPGTLMLLILTLQSSWKLSSCCRSCTLFPFLYKPPRRDLRTFADRVESGYLLGLTTAGSGRVTATPQHFSVLVLISNSMVLNAPWYEQTLYLLLIKNETESTLIVQLPAIAKFGGGGFVSNTWQHLPHLLLEV